MNGMRHHVDAAFIPLTDCAPLIVAHELGFAAQEGLELNLFKETSWATLRDRLAVAHIDVAHALAPMPVASNLGLGPLPQTLIAPIALGSGGNTVTVSKNLWSDLQAHDCPVDFDPTMTRDALAKVVADNKSNRSEKLHFAIVHPHSSHRYELAYWLASGGIMPGRDVEFVVIPPSLMATALGNGSIDGFCAGEPWGSMASVEGVGKILTSKAHIWRSSPEKVLAIRARWADEHPDKVHCLLRAIYRSCNWCDQAINHDALAEILSRESYLNLPAEVILPGLNRRLIAGNGQPRTIDGLLNFGGWSATYPWPGHALWLYSQMVRWGEIDCTENHEQLAKSTSRPNIYQEALGGVLEQPVASAQKDAVKEEASSLMDNQIMFRAESFFDELAFDPLALGHYIDRLMIQDQKFREARN